MRLTPAIPLLVVLLLTACGDNSNTKEPESDPTTALEATSTPVATAPSPEPTNAPTEPTSTPQTAPEPTATAEPTPDAPDFTISGTDEFVAWTQQALDLIETSAPEWYEQVTASIDTIESVTAGSGMDVFTKTYRVGEVTAYAPGFSTDQQLIWYAGTIVHDSCHSDRYTEGLEYSGKDAEIACMMDQKTALELMTSDTYFTTYVQSLIDGADDPANEYWNNPNRHW